MLRGWGAEPVDLGICPDEGEALAERCARRAGLDLLVTTGGASVGDHDLVQRVLGREGMELDFWKIAMRPGKPLLSGRLGAVPVLGFPGNPVSTAVCALVFLRAALQKMLGLPVGLRLREVRNRQRAATQRPAPGLSAGELCRGLGRAPGAHGRAAGQLDAGDVRRGRRAGGPPALRPGAARRRHRAPRSTCARRWTTCGRNSTTCA